MVVKQAEAAKAFKSVQDLNSQKLNSGRLAKQIYELHSELKKAYDFQTQEENKIFESHPAFDRSLGGIRLDGLTDEEKAKAMEEVKAIDAELRELADLDFELDFEPFELNLDDVTVKLSGEDIGNLSPFIEFI